MSAQTEIDPDTAQNGNAPEWGAAVEKSICQFYGLEYVDNGPVDARTSTGQDVQIKGVQEWVSAGPGRRRGQVTLWRETLRHFEDAGGLYIIVVYDPDADPEDPEAFIESHALAAPETIAAIAEDRWQKAVHDRKKGRRAQISWQDVYRGIKG